MNELMLTSEFVTARFYRRHIFIQCGGHGVYRELGSRDACGFESALLFGIEVIDVFLDHVLDTVGYAERHVFYICRRTVSGVPSASTTVFAASSIQKPKCSSTLDEVLPLGVSTMTTFFARQFR